MAVAASCLLAATSASASTGIGGTYGISGTLVGCQPGALYVQTGVGGAPSYTIPADGVITSWSTLGWTGQTGGLAMKVVLPVSASIFKVTGTSAVETVTPNVLNQFRTRVSVSAGDRIALFASGSTFSYCAFGAGASDQIRFSPTGQPEPAIGTEVVTTSPFSQYRLNVSAQLEADVDGDGYGDETQDDCPAEPLAHDLPCDRTPPETVVAPVPGKLKLKKGKTAKFSVSFASSEEGSSFTCTLDGKSSACSSPFTANVKKGSHHFSVVATDAAGNADPTPAEADFTVKAKKKPKRAA